MPSSSDSPNPESSTSSSSSEPEVRVIGKTRLDAKTGKFVKGHMPPCKRRGKHVLKTITTKGLKVLPDDLRAYKPNNRDKVLCEAILSGARSITDVVLFNPDVLTEGHVKRTLRENPVACAWIADQVGQAATQRMGMVIGHLYGIATTSDSHTAIRAAETLFKLMKKDGPVLQLNLAETPGMDFNNLSDKALTAMLEKAKSAVESK